MERQTKKRKSILKRWWFWVLIIIVVITVIPKGGSDTPVNKPTTSNSTGSIETPKKTEPAKETESPEPTSKITYENFLKIAMGAKMESVNTLLGEGTETSSSEVGGVKTAIYSWSGPGISNLNVTIQNGIVTGKAQAGLQSMDAKVTLEKYNQIKENMTYDQVKAILGEGQLTSQTKIMDLESTMYEWINKDGSNMNGTFSGGKLQMKSQFGLK